MEFFEKKRKNILIIQNKVMEYRIPLFDYFQRNVGNITICHSGVLKIDPKFNIKEVILHSNMSKGFVITKGLLSLAKKYDIVVGMFDLKWISICLLPFFLHRRIKFFFWGIGVTTNNGFDVSNKWDFLRFFLAKQANGTIFYSDYPIEKYIKGGVNPKKIFVANNTVFCDEKIVIENKRQEKFLFIGQLKKTKKIEILIHEFAKFKKKDKKNIFLEIVGNGEEYQYLKDFVKELGLESNIHFLGYVSDYHRKKELFSNAIASISVGQAGLSVLESFAYGVPFITNKNSITGGERLNIVNWENGVLLDDNNNLSEVLLKLTNDMNLAKKLSVNCYNFYWENRKIEDMAEGFIESFNID